VIGNPRTDGFYTVFAGEMPKGSEGLPALEGARKEAETVQALLQQHGYGCQLSLEENGVDVINKLYQQPYRVLHIAGHGVYEQLTRQGDRRSGVVLSSGILITAAEIEAMEVVPDLVFLNCCHPGTVKREAVAFNRLAASVARQLIEMGVRAVVACGWAVDDQAAVVFAKVFYGAMLSGTPFGEAVFQARKEVHVAFPDLNTWGAYQAYGDPSYLLPMAVKRAEADAACNVAYLAMVRGDFNKAVRYLQMAVETNPNDLDAALQLGNAWTGLGNLTKTREVLEAAIRRAVDLGDQQQVGYALIALGDAMVSAGDGQTALDSYKEALRICEVLAQKDNTNIEWLMDVADCCVKLGSSISNLNNDERIKYLSRGLEILSDLKHTGMLIPERDMTSWFENELNSLPKNGLEYPPGTGSSEQAPEWPGQHR
jgi:tetratricopeptide (TPR) repeat protein